MPAFWGSTSSSAAAMLLLIGQLLGRPSPSGHLMFENLRIPAPSSSTSLDLETVHLEERAASASPYGIATHAR